MRNYVNNLSGGSSITRNRVRVHTEAKLLLTLQYHANYIEIGEKDGLLGLAILSNNNKSNQELYNVLKNFN